MKVRCLAIDDEELALELLVDNIRKVPFLELVAFSSDPFEALEILQKEKIDLVFLDIQMPGLTGLQFIKSLPDSCLYILVTAYDKYALEGFNLQVVDYLVKPVAMDRFIQAAKRAQDLLALKLQTSKSGQVADKDYFFLQIDYSHVKVSFNEIRWIEGLKDYVKLHMRDPSKPLIARISMKALEQQLPTAQFLRIHKSFIVSIQFVTSIRKNSLFIGEMELPVGENYKDTIAAFMGNPNRDQE
ncbi:LytR/AlgR family response regulator transcription factor [Flavihumibacter sp. UBA7668]|uniref:LytR/AlgR family response regulator transcription factor n=1 Tax=Flavihumibacter sp. UBA7668 TaxID=1946542 RepID=UPI0025C4A9E8|nr:LytTR family DNA-binding domain-containing protein [Flavihumibacter sp. UBA7668]